MTTKPYLFASYSRRDNVLVSAFVEALQAAGIDVWRDVDNLAPGVNWQHAIQDALEHASGLLVFISEQSIQSEWIQREIAVIAHRDDRLVIPIILERVAEMPQALKEWQWVNLVGTQSIEEIREAASHFAVRIQEIFNLGKTRLDISPASLSEASQDIASTVRSEKTKFEDDGKTPSSVFIAHGHDKIFLEEVESFVRSLTIEPVVLTKIGGHSQSLFQKFLNESLNSRFAIVLISADDFGVSKRQYDAVGDRALQFRARQNVILELGFFYGLLGWENVFVLRKDPEVVFPNFESPSDLDGVVFDKVDESGGWKLFLRKRLVEAGFNIPNVNGEGTERPNNALDPELMSHGDSRA